MIKYYLAKALKKLKPSAIKNSKIDKKAYIAGGNTIINSEMGRYSYTSYDTQILWTVIGRFCSIGSDCKIGGAGHPLERVSTSPVFHEGRNVLKKHFAEFEYDPFTETHIGNDVWIGQNAMIKSGVTIGDGAVIGMGAVVTKDVGPYEIWAGNPAKLIRKRFDEETINKLLELKWWLWDDEKLQKYGEFFLNPSEFCDMEEE